MRNSLLEWELEWEREWESELSSERECEFQCVANEREQARKKIWFRRRFSIGLQSDFDSKLRGSKLPTRKFRVLNFWVATSQSNRKIRRQLWSRPSKNFEIVSSWLSSSNVSYLANSVRYQYENFWSRSSREVPIKHFVQYRRLKLSIRLQTFRSTNILPIKHYLTEKALFTTTIQV